MEEVQFHDAFTYYYNPIEGTEAAGMNETVSQEVKMERLSKIIELQHTITQQVHREKVGSIVPVLAEGVSKKSREEILARTEHNQMVVFPGSEQVIGSFTSVKLIEYSGNTYRGEEVL
jgi:tRNA-2-methylthio-N6-dimethylallyladenosine synthase